MVGKSLAKISDVSSLSISTAFTDFSATRAACFLSGMRVSSQTERSDQSCLPLANVGIFSRYSDAMISLWTWPSGPAKDVPVPGRDRWR